jgi:hypothetical protein
MMNVTETFKYSLHVILINLSLNSYTIFMPLSLYFSDPDLFPFIPERF